MPLHDQFRPKRAVAPDGFLITWAVKIIESLEPTLPAEYRGLPFSHLSGLAEVENDIGIAIWAPPKPRLESRASFTDQDLFEIQIVRKEFGELVAAIELVSRSNKDRPESRRSLCIKCASYLQADVSVMVVDIVTERAADFHEELLQLLQVDDKKSSWQSPTDLYACPYRTVRKKKQGHYLQAWCEALTIGGTLPILPLWLDSDLAIPLDLEKSYIAVRKSLRLTS